MRAASIVLPRGPERHLYRVVTLRFGKLVRGAGVWAVRGWVRANRNLTPKASKRSQRLFDSYWRSETA
ncbi:hypothetical protein SGL43_01487 [Streptomyces globisporus]|uniref:Uncharacterized protein n=1 Tax=Streptomyces globisporus TaxID=1908 RepID=A0ABM9GSQ7_STRGL|nr:hypothetical protein SGL43_01487 [Streptomyces globisporus]